MEKTEVSEIEQPEFRTSFDSVDSSDNVEVPKSNLESVLDGNEDIDDDEIDGDESNAVFFDVNKKSTEGCRDEDIDKAVSLDLISGTDCIFAELAQSALGKILGLVIFLDEFLTKFVKFLDGKLWYGYFQTLPFCCNF